MSVKSFLNLFEEAKVLKRISDCWNQIFLEYPLPKTIVVNKNFTHLLLFFDLGYLFEF